MARLLAAMAILVGLPGTARAEQVVIIEAPPRPALAAPEGAPAPVVAAFELGTARARFGQAWRRARQTLPPDEGTWARVDERVASAAADLDRARMAALEGWLARTPPTAGAAAAHLVAGWLRIDTAEAAIGEASAPDFGPARKHLEAAARTGDGPIARSARVALASIAGNDQRRLTLLEEVVCPAAEPSSYTDCPAPAADDAVTQFAWAALASLHLERDAPERAAAAAGKLDALPASPYYPSALYHRAYGLYLAEQPEAALEAFLRVTREPALAPLAREGWEYVTLILYGLPDGLDRAEALFRTDTRAEPRQVFVGLADMYRLDERKEEALRALELAIAGWPEHRDLPRTAHQAVTLDVEVNGNAHGAVVAVTLVDRLLRDGDWYRANADDVDAIARRDRFVETVLLFVGDFFLTVAADPKHTMPVPTAQRAGEAFALLLREVPESPARFQATFGRGRALELQGQLGEARAEYELVREKAADPELRAAAEKRLAKLPQKR